MSNTQNEVLFHFFDKVRTNLKLEETNRSEIMSNISDIRFAPKNIVKELLEVKVFVSYLAKNDDMRSVWMALAETTDKAIQKCCKGMAELGYTFQDYPLREESVYQKYQNFKRGSEFSFREHILTFHLSKKALIAALKKCDEELTQLKKSPSYFSQAVITSMYDKDEVIDFFTPSTVCNEISNTAGDFPIRKFEHLAMGDTMGKRVKYTTTAEPVVIQRPIFMKISASISHEDQDFTLSIDCRDHIGRIEVKNAKGCPVKILLLDRVNNSFFGLTKAQMKSFLVKHLIRGAKITEFTALKTKYKHAMSNHAKYTQIQYLTDYFSPEDFSRVPVCIKISKTGEIETLVLNDLSDQPSAELAKEVAKRFTQDDFKDLFSNNRLFAFERLSTIFRSGYYCSQALFC